MKRIIFFRNDLKQVMDANLINICSELCLQSGKIMHIFAGKMEYKYY